MGKRHVFKNIYFWLGIIRLLIGIACIYSIYYIWNTDSKLIAKIAITLFGALGSFGCYVEGVDALKKAIK